MSDTRIFVVEVVNYEPGDDDEALTTDRMERLVTGRLEPDGSDGIVIVTEQAPA